MLRSDDDFEKGEVGNIIKFIKAYGELLKKVYENSVIVDLPEYMENFLTCNIELE